MSQGLSQRHREPVCSVFMFGSPVVTSTCMGAGQMTAGITGGVSGSDQECLNSRVFSRGGISTVHTEKCKGQVLFHSSGGCAYRVMHLMLLEITCKQFQNYIKLLVETNDSILKCADSIIKESQAYTGVISRGCPIGTGINANRSQQFIRFGDNSYVILEIP